MFTPNSDAMQDNPVSGAMEYLDALQQPPRRVIANPPTRDFSWQSEPFTNNLDTPGSSDALSSSFSYPPGFECQSVPCPVTDVSNDQQWNHYLVPNHLSSQPSFGSPSTRRRSCPATSGSFMDVRQLASGSTRRASVIDQSSQFPTALYNAQNSLTQGQIQKPFEWGLSRTNDLRLVPALPHSMDRYDPLPSLPTPPVGMRLPTDGHNLPPTSQHAQNFPGFPDPVELSYVSIHCSPFIFASS